MIDYTPVPEELPDTLLIPQDVSDDVVVSTVNPNTAALANAAKLRKDIAGSYLIANIKTGLVSAGGQFPLDKISQGGSVDTDGITVFISEPGIYSVSFFFFGTCPDVLAGVDVTFYQTSPLVDKLRAAAWQGSNASTILTFSVSGLIVVTTPSGAEQPFTLANLDHDIQVSGVASSRLLSINRIK